LGAGPVADVLGVGDRLPAGGHDLVDHLLRGTDIAAAAVHRAADVVHHDLRTLRREQQGVLAADAPAGARHDGDPSVTDAHCVSSQESGLPRPPPEGPARGSPDGTVASAERLGSLRLTWQGVPPWTGTTARPRPARATPT